MLTVGADPELFVGRGGHFVSAHGLIPGTKDAPFPVGKGAVQVDGVALEFNINPAKSLKEFRDNLASVCKDLKAMVPHHQFLRAVTVEITPKHRSSIPIEALMIGCNSDVNAYTGDSNEPPSPEVSIRSAGGHLHIGGLFKEGQREVSKYIDALRMARLMDRYVGVYSLLWDTNLQRRRIYGSAGACRIKEYGVEYRSLSNSWLFRPRITTFIYQQLTKAFEAFHREEDVQSEEFAGIINQSAVEHQFFSKDLIALQLKKLLRV